MKVKTKRKSKPKPPREPKYKWSDAYYVQVYDLARDGLSIPDIAAAIGCGYQTLRKWLVEKPALQEAFDRATATVTETFASYVYRHLSPDLKVLYDEITSLAEEGDPLNRIVKLLSDKGDHVKQHLFLHALVESNFNPSEALSKLRVGKETLDAWVRTCPEFGRLCEQVIWHKRNFLEGALFKLVAQGDKSAVIFASKTLNADRGYGNTLKVRHEGEVTHTGQIRVGDLPIPLEDKKRILKALRAKQEEVEEGEYEAK